MGAGSSCGGLGGKSGPQPTRIVSVIAAVGAISPNNHEIAIAEVKRRTKAPPNRRGQVGMFISNLAVTSLIVIILKLIILLIGIRIISGAEYFKLCQVKQVISGSNA